MAAGKSEVASSLDLNVLRYSMVWEDHAVLEAGLDIQHDDSVLSISSAGDNVLNLLLKEPAHIVALDMSPMQNAFVQLKLAAIRELKHDQFLLLLGLFGSGDDRMELFRNLESLPEDARQLLSRAEVSLRYGIIHCGRLEKWLQKFVRDVMSPIIGGDCVKAFANSATLEEQREQLASWPMDILEEPCTRHLSGDTQSKEGRSAAQLKYVPLDSNEVGKAMWKNTVNVFRTVPMRGNIYCQWMLLGAPSLAEVDQCVCGDKDTEEQLLPPYLHLESFDKLRRLVDRVEVVTDSLENFLERKQKFSKANLSDVFEYMSEEASDVLFTKLAGCCKPGGRVAFWNLLADRCPREGKSPSFRRLAELSDRLTAADRFTYKAFHVVELS